MDGILIKCSAKERNNLFGITLKRKRMKPKCLPVHDVILFNHIVRVK
jgi:hypothetical protein